MKLEHESDSFVPELSKFITFEFKDINTINNKRTITGLVVSSTNDGVVGQISINISSQLTSKGAVG